LSSHPPVLALAACLLGCGSALAGLGLDESLQRHGELLGNSQTSRNAPTRSTPDLALPDSVTFALAGRSESLPPFVREQIGGRGGVQVLFGESDPASGFAWRLGAGWADRDQYHYNFGGSELSLRLGNGRIYLSDQRRHWGPSWAGSLILDNGAAPIPALGWRKTDASAFSHPWLSWLGPWNLDVFVGALAGHTQPANPKFWGARFQFMPLDGLEIGLSRTLEWGGRGRSESLGTFWRSMVGQDNVDGGNTHDPGNQLAGFDARYTFAIDRSAAISLYGQAIGEDEAGLLPTKYLGSFGADVAFGVSGRSMRVFLEYANTMAGGIVGRDEPGVAYQHSVYLQGYTNRHMPLGFPAGGDVSLNTLGLLFDTPRVSGLAMVHHGRAEPSAQLYGRSGTLAGANAEISLPVARRSRVGASVAYWRDPVASSTRAQVWWRYALR
jgi:hypothetical protein